MIKFREIHAVGRLGIGDLGRVQPGTRNPLLVTAVGTVGHTEDRYSGILRIRRLMAEAGLSEPAFRSQRGEFIVCLYNHKEDPPKEQMPAETDAASAILDYCRVPRSRQEITDFLQLSSQGYAMRRYVAPLVKSGMLKLTRPEKPRSSQQRCQTRAVTPEHSPVT